MESTIVFAALLLVIVLLAVAVYDTNPTLRVFLGRIIRRERCGKDSLEEGETAASLDGEKPEGEQEDEPLGESQSIIKRIVGKLRGMLRRRKKSEGDQGDSAVDPVGLLQNTVDDLVKRLAQAEAALNKISQLEKGLAKVSEDTTVLSEDFKDVLGSVRVSIDKLESRLEKVAASQTGQTDDKGSVDDSKVRIGQLEADIANIVATLGSIPPKVQNTEMDIREINSRLESISMDIQRTLGYGIQKTFKCGSCGSEGFVASQVVCSKCGTGSMWGWWPPNEELSGPERADAEINFKAIESSSAT